jgi:hypothetical protein
MRPAKQSPVNGINFGVGSRLHLEMYRANPFV